MSAVKRYCSWGEAATHSTQQDQSMRNRVDRVSGWWPEPEVDRNRLTAAEIGREYYAGDGIELIGNPEPFPADIWMLVCRVWTWYALGWGASANFPASQQTPELIWEDIERVWQLNGGHHLKRQYVSDAGFQELQRRCVWYERLARVPNQSWLPGRERWFKE